MVYNTPIMVETLRELNRQAIVEGLLLPGGQSFRDDYNPILGESLSPREETAYSLIHKSPRPVTTIELVDKMYPDYIKAGLKYNAKSIIWTLISDRLKKKLGETAIISYDYFGYLSRRSMIMRNVEERAENVPSEGIEPPSYP